MIISKTPFRVSFFGGGTDYLPWVKEHGGASLSVTIDKYCYITCRYLPKFFAHKTRLVYSNIELVKDNKDIQHSSIREVLAHLGVTNGLEIHHDADLPARTGLASSSAFTVGLLNAVRTLIGRKSEKIALAREAIHIEQDRCKENVGCQDQLATAIGGLNLYTFNFDVVPKYDVTRIQISMERIKELQSNLMLFFTGFSRTASEIAKHQIENIPKKTQQLKRMKQMVYEAHDILYTGELDNFGSLLHEGWCLKREMSDKVSNAEIDALYKTACFAGALGGKLLGAGGGGFLLLYVPQEKQREVKEALKNYLHVPFKFEFIGTEIVGNK